MSKVSFAVPGVPQPEPRKRVRVIPARPGKKATAHLYTPADDKVNTFKQAVALAARNAVGARPPSVDAACHVNMTFVLACPKCQRSRSAGRIPCISKPDVDNFAKAVLDALNLVLWKDDASVYSLAVVKMYAGVGEKPHIEVTVRWEDDDV